MINGSTYIRLLHYSKNCVISGLRGGSISVKFAYSQVFLRNSDWGDVPSGVSQGTKLSPWLFTIMIKDLSIGGISLWKYVDDGYSQTVLMNHSKIQKHVGNLSKLYSSH